MAGYMSPQNDPAAEKEAGLRRRDLIGLLLLAIVAGAMIAIALVAGGGADAPD